MPALLLVELSSKTVLKDILCFVEERGCMLKGSAAYHRNSL